jgi:hypothetical protein
MEPVQSATYDMSAGRDALLSAATGNEVTELNQPARLDRVTAGNVSAGGRELHDGTVAGVSAR